MEGKSVPNSIACGLTYDFKLIDNPAFPAYSLETNTFGELTVVKQNRALELLMNLKDLPPSDFLFFP